MSDRSQALPAPEGEFVETSRFGGLSILFALLALVGLGLGVVGAMVDPAQFSFSWLFAFAFFFTLCAGCFFWTLVQIGSRFLLWSAWGWASSAQWSIRRSLVFPGFSLLLSSSRSAPAASSGRLFITPPTRTGAWW